MTTISSHQFRRALYVLVWIAFLGSVALTAAALPLCYVPERVRAAAQHAPFLQSLLQWRVFALATIDASGASVVCVMLFLGVFLRHLENQDSFKDIGDGLTSHLGNPTAVKPDLLRDLDREMGNLGSEAGNVQHRVAAFGRMVLARSDLVPYENYLVTLGLLGTLAGFYLGFASDLKQVTYANLQATADNLLRVVGTATISSLVGIGLGMLVVRPMAEKDALQVDRLVELASRNWEGKP
jgi:hypothetical protein